MNWEKITGSKECVAYRTCLAFVLVAGCTASQTESTGDATNISTKITSTENSNSIPVGSLNPALFVEGALVDEVSIEDCTLSGGTESRCYKLKLAGAPADENSPVGPFCPESITSTKEEGGTWFDGDGTVYDVDGEFIVNLPTIYNNDEWQMYDTETGLVTVIDGDEGCAVAGDPKNAPAFNNFCLECSLSALGGGIEKTLLIPVTPVPQETPTRLRRNNIGLALNGVLLGPPAPTDFILSTITLGVFDDCGGHANPHEGYHYHAANGCSELGQQTDDHAVMIGYAIDGYGIFARENAQGEQHTDLDACGGATDELRGYHYHASAPGTNSIIGCLSGEQGSQLR